MPKPLEMFPCGKCDGMEWNLGYVGDLLVICCTWCGSQYENKLVLGSSIVCCCCNETVALVTDNGPVRAGGKEHTQ